MNFLTVKQFLKNIRAVFRGYKLVIILNFHRIGEVDSDNPFHTLHSVSPKIFKRQISILSKVAKFVSLDDVRNIRGLAPLNIIITFDDVSKTVLDIKPWLEEKHIPFAVAPCVEIMDKGYGPRDKVYFIMKYMDKIEITQFVKSKGVQLTAGMDESFSFYDYTKANEADPFYMEKEIIDPLFKRIKDFDQKLDNEKPYLNWEDIRKHFLGNGLVSIVNHGWRHLKMINFSREDVFRDVEVSTKKFEEELGFSPVYYAVPFGGTTQDLLVDLNDALREYSYRGVLWTNAWANLVKNPSQAQMIHLSRIHTPPTFFALLKSVLKSLTHAQKQIKNRVISRPSKKDSEYQLKTASHPDPIFSFENLNRQGRDYASDKNFYDYLYASNPYQENKPYYYAVESQGRMEAIRYKLYLHYYLFGKEVEGIVSMGWRKLPETKTIASSLTYNQIIQDEPIVGIYKPSEDTLKVYEFKIWKKIKVYNCLIRLGGNKPNGRMAAGEIREFRSFPDEIKALCEEIPRHYPFTIARTPQFYRWRFDHYPLLKEKPYYIVLYEESQPRAFFVLQTSEDSFSIADFYYSTFDHFKILFDYLYRKGLEDKSVKIGIETTLEEVRQYLKDTYKAQITEFNMYYHFNKKFEQNKDVVDKINKEWNQFKFHQTQASGDVLLRPSAWI